MKVIAIEDAPFQEIPTIKGIRKMMAYQKGDIFEVINNIGWLIIKHDKLGLDMEVSIYNFMELHEWRTQQIEKIMRND
jgi:hypothetical protein